MARPPKSPELRRDLWLPKTRVAPSELALIKERSARAGVSFSEYARRLLMTGSIVQRTPLADKELVRSLSAVGNNINQIARTANVTGELDPLTSDRLRSALDALEGLIERLIHDC